MFSTLHRGTAWRWLVIAALLAAVMLPFMPTAAYAASGSNEVESKSQDASWYGYSCKAYYTVQPGNQLGQIAKWYNVSLYDISRANGITNPSLIYVGQTLCIPYGSPYGYYSGYNKPTGCYYTVQYGDNLSRIAARYGIPWPHMAQTNHLYSPWTIIPGQTLYVCW